MLLLFIGEPWKLNIYGQAKPPEPDNTVIESLRIGKDGSKNGSRRSLSSHLNATTKYILV
jgi:hypothetical protein